MKLDGQVAIIVGGARGIGESIAHTFSKEGANLVLVDLEKMKAQLEAGGKRHQRAGKASQVRPRQDDRQVNALVDETVPRSARRCASHRAGFRGPWCGARYQRKEWDDVHLYISIGISMLPRLRKQMIKQKAAASHISGTAGREGMALRGSLCAAKWGLTGLMQTIAKEAGPYGIRANVICPGGMDEPDLREMYAERAKGLGMEFSQLEKQVLELTPLRKYAKHDEVAKSALFCSSDSSTQRAKLSTYRAGG